jgi:hypothetical protein
MGEIVQGFVYPGIFESRGLGVVYGDHIKVGIAGGPYMEEVIAPYCGD